VPLEEDLQRDIAAVAGISAVPTILRTIRESTGLRYTLIARVLPDRWVACAVHDEIDFGLGVGGELDVATTLCSVVRDTHEPVVIENVGVDPVYCGHPTPRMYGFQSYIAVPIFRRSGEYFGNICGLDPLPRTLKDAKTLSTLRLFSELISLQLEAEERHEGDRAALCEQREAAKLREEFIAVLGHDLRNPLNAIQVGTDLLLQQAASRERRVLERIGSSTRRISGLVEDLLDLARGRLGGGIPLDRAEVSDLEARLRHVLAEVQASYPERSVTFEASIQGPVSCDPKRIEQLLSNLLGNALQHGAPAKPVQVLIQGGGSELRIVVVNHGPPISEEAKSQLFQPYMRGSTGTARDGLGLGLYIVAQIAQSHGGQVDVVSEGGLCTFTFSMSAASGAV
jgi:signal transduction histidine kinase